MSYVFHFRFFINYSIDFFLLHVQVFSICITAVHSC